jgi:hypothetical protein
MATEVTAKEVILKDPSTGVYLIPYVPKEDTLTIMYSEEDEQLVFVSSASDVTKQVDDINGEST